MRQTHRHDTNPGISYRYPGSRPFSDSELDRRLFFGRDDEIQYLFHSILVENLFVLFSKSGMGKTSLLNAGVMELLRQENFLPLPIRFNDRESTPLDLVYSGIEEAVTQWNKKVEPAKKIDYEPGETATLWQYFNTAAFWSSDDKPLTPILIFDQFEEFFTMHSPEQREAFLVQLADLVRGRVPAAVRNAFKAKEHFPYSDTAPEVKIIISIREDYLGHLEEMSEAIPGILKNRFRLLPLKREKAKDAIIKPAGLSEDEYIRARGFSYAVEAVDEMLDFLCERREGGEEVKTHEVEPFQLQLLCQHIEETVSKKIDPETGTDGYVVQKSDLGGKAGMRKVLQGFYERRIGTLHSARAKMRVRKLCEKGLIDNKSRLSLEQRYITRKYNVSKALLSQLVDGRLLRSEPRVGSVYFELSHDTLVEPILKSQRERKVKRNRIVIPLLALILILLVITVPNQIMNNMKISTLYEEAVKLRLDENYKEAIEKYESILKIDNSRALPYEEIGKLSVKIKDYQKGIDNYKNAIDNEINIDKGLLHYQLGRMYEYKKKQEESIDCFKKAIELNPVLAEPHISLGDIYRKQPKYKEDPEKEYKLALQKSGDKNADAYKGLALLYLKQKKPNEAIAQYKKAVEVCPKKCAHIYRDIAKEMRYRRLSRELEELYRIADKVKVDDPTYYEELGNDCYRSRNYELAAKNYEKTLGDEAADPKKSTYKRLIRAYIYDKQPDKAISAYRKAVTANPDYAYFYEDIVWAIQRAKKVDVLEPFLKIASGVTVNDSKYYEKLGSYWVKYLKNNDMAIENYKKALELDKNASIYKSLAIAYIKKGVPGEAINLYREAIDINTEYAYIYSYIAKELKKEKRNDELEELYRTASTFDSREAVYYEKLATAFSSLKEYDRAIDCYKKALELDNKKSSTYKRLAVAYINRGEIEEAINVYRDAVNVSADFAYMYNDICQEILKKKIDLKVLNRYGNMDDAMKIIIKEKGGEFRKLLQIASQVESKEAAYYLEIGRIFFLSGEYEWAIKTLKKVLRINPESEDVYAGIGTAFGRLGKYKEAIEYYRKAMQINPENINAKSNLAELELINDNFSNAFILANELLESKKLSPGYNLPIRFILVCSLVFQQKKSRAYTELEKIVKLYIPKSRYSGGGWSYKLAKDFITKTKKLRKEDRNLLLELIGILESSTDRNQKLKAFEEKYLKGKKSL